MKMKDLNHMKTKLDKAATIVSIADYIGFPGTQVFAADERVNLGGSHKDRPVIHMLHGGVEAGEINEETTVVDYTTGSEGIAVARNAQRAGIRAVLIMPENITVEREKEIRSTDAELILTPPDRAFAEDEKDLSEHRIWVRGAAERARIICKERPNHYLLNQSGNIANKESFYPLAASFLARFIEQPLDYMVIASGTGATVTGIGHMLKTHSPRTQIVAVNVAKSPDLWALKTGNPLHHEPHKLYGTGPGASSPITRKWHGVVDSVARVNDEECYEVAKELISRGLKVGPTTAANVIVIREILRQKPHACIGTILFDHSDRYKSVGL